MSTTFHHELPEVDDSHNADDWWIMRRSVMSRAALGPLRPAEIITVDLKCETATTNPIPKFRIVVTRKPRGRTKLVTAYEAPTFREAETAFGAVLRELSSQVYRFVPLHLGSASLPLSDDDVYCNVAIDGDVAELLRVLSAELHTDLVSKDIDTTQLSPQSIDSAVAVLMQLQDKLDGETGVIPGAIALDLSRQFFSYLPSLSTSSTAECIDTAEKLLSWCDVCATLKDTTIACGETAVSASVGIASLFDDLGCEIEAVKPDTTEFAAVMQLANQECDEAASIHRIFRIARASDFARFAAAPAGNTRLLFHGTKAVSILGILLNGLSLPFVAVQKYHAVRTNQGNLGAGIYFSDAFESSVQYTSVCATGSRFMVVCEVSLGNVFQTAQTDPTLLLPPAGFDSVHGIKGVAFTSDEYVIFSPARQRMRYLIEFRLSAEPQAPSSSPASFSWPKCQQQLLPTQHIPKITDTREKAHCALTTSAGVEVPLEAASIHARIVDTIAEVVMFQQYCNASSAPIEAKFLLPLDDGAAVTGFEAFIREKHVVGVVKEKEMARREFKEAVERGDGAFLLDEADSNVFTINMGNVPAKTRVIVKISFVSSLKEADEGFMRKWILPASLTGSQRARAAFISQVTTRSVEATTRSTIFKMEIGVAMPGLIADVFSTTHTIWFKRSGTKATIKVDNTELLATDFVLYVRTSAAAEIPRMWLEELEGDDHAAAMLSLTAAASVDDDISMTESVVIVDISSSMNSVLPSLKSSVSKLLFCAHSLL